MGLLDFFRKAYGGGEEKKYSARCPRCGYETDETFSMPGMVRVCEMCSPIPGTTMDPDTCWKCGDRPGRVGIQVDEKIFCPECYDQDIKDRGGAHKLCSRCGKYELPARTTGGETLCAPCYRARYHGAQGVTASVGTRPKNWRFTQRVWRLGDKANEPARSLENPVSEEPEAQESPRVFLPEDVDE